MSNGTHLATGKSPARSRDGVAGRAIPSPTRLATPTDLAPQEAQAVTAALNPLVADLIALYLKTKNFHWHVSGPRFRDYHLLFDEHAHQIFAGVDLLAERVRKLGGTTIRSVSHVGQLQTIADDDEELVAASEMARRLMADNAHLARAQRAAHEVCERSHDYATTNVLEVLIDEAERRTWFLFELTQGGD
jgi:starvation-inducible DNA-binding protein